MNKVRVALIQMKSSYSPGMNLNNAVKRICEARKKRANIVCLGELFRTPYFCQTKEKRFFCFSEKIPGHTTDVLRKVAQKEKVVIIAPVFEKCPNGRCFNTAVVIDADGKILGKYRKMHLPDEVNYYEKYYFSGGDLGFRAFNTKYGKIGILICWDQWYPEAARLTVLDGADILFFPTAIGSPSRASLSEEKTEKSAWKMIQQSHAIANGVFVACVNRAGKENNLKFWGCSFIAAPTGKIVASSSGSKEEIIIADCIMNQIQSFRHAWPFLRERRIDAYRPILRKYPARGVQ